MLVVVHRRLWAFFNDMELVSTRGVGILANDRYEMVDCGATSTTTTADFTWYWLPPHDQ
jgi:hypothetical protein